jgi:hypothetical protein
VKRATNLPLSKDAPSVPAFADVARLVAGTDAPPWLAAHFERWTPSLMLDRCIEDKQPKKSETKKRLTEVRDAALLLRDASPHLRARILAQEEAAFSAASFALLRGSVTTPWISATTNTG